MDSLELVVVSPLRRTLQTATLALSQHYYHLTLSTSLQNRLVASRVMDSLDLVVISPLRRTLQTATLALSDHVHPTIPMVALEAIRETAGK